MRMFSDWIVNERSSEGQKSAQGLVEKARDHRVIDLSGGVVERRSSGIEHHDVRDVAAIIFLLELLLFRGQLMVEVNNDKLNASSVFLIESDRTPRLPFGVEAALSVHHYVRGLTRNEAGLHAVAGDEGPVLAVAGGVGVRI